MKIAVFCSASADTTPEMKNDAQTIGRLIGEGKHTLVYGGVALGLMEITARAVKDSGGTVIGVIPRSREAMASKLCDTTITVDNLHQRKQVMEQTADAFVALSGGFGTLDEIIATWASLTFDNVDKTIAVVNRDKLYEPLKQQIKKMADTKMLRVENALKLKFADTAEEAFDIVAGHLQN